MFKGNQAKFIFQQDGARPHTAAITRKTLSDEGVSVLKWPPYSPDLNIIENIWGLVQARMDKKYFATFGAF